MPLKKKYVSTKRVSSSAPKVLFCPLNWGLGHATRCIPLIRKYIQEGKTVHIASDGAALALLREEFPTLDLYRLPSYNIRYSRKGLSANFVFRLPGIWKAIRDEHGVLAELQEKNGYDLIVSDNRYGCHSDKTKSIFITHQLNLETPSRIFSILLDQIQRKYLRKFDEIWVPDFEGDEALAGRMSRNVDALNVKYIGPLSRMNKLDMPLLRDILVVLSGPEPQRSILEDTLVEQMRLLPYSGAIVRGLPQEGRNGYVNGLHYYSFATTAELEELINSSRLIICRSGYSSIMDLYQLNKNALLIPTPGQYEQEYLAKIHSKGTQWYVQSQKELDLRSFIESVGISTDHPSRYSGERLIIIGGHRMRHSDRTET